MFLKQFTKLCAKNNVVFILINILTFVIILQVLLSQMFTFINTNESLHRPKYILTWDKYYLISESGQKYFSDLKCDISNCIVTSNRDLLGNYSNFDAILFFHNHLKKKSSRPTHRTNSQIYIFTTIESSANQPACAVFNDDFFNWTFTPRLDSDIVWNYFVVRNASKSIVAPSEDPKWVKTDKDISPKIREVINGRKKAVAWLVSNCGATSLRHDYLTRLQEHLFHFALTVDVFGSCTDTKCVNNDCEEMLRNNYYFSIAFENSLAKDYVTEKVLHGYDNYVVPIVYGDANYSRFLPPGSYINAREFHPYNLAHLINRAVNDPKLYESYLKWTNFYTIDSGDSVKHPLCDLCKALNSDRAERAPVKKKFRSWWNGQNGFKWCLSPEFWSERNQINIEGTYFYNYITLQDYLIFLFNK